MSVTIISFSVLEIGFSEDDYTADEGDGVRPNTPCSVVVELIETSLEIPLQVQLTPTVRDATGKKCKVSQYFCFGQSYSRPRLQHPELTSSSSKQ